MLSSFLPPQHDEPKSADFTPRLADGKRKDVECGTGLCASNGDGRRTLAMPSDNVKALPDSVTPGSACACKPPSAPSFSSRTAFGQPTADASGETGPMRAFSSVLTDSLS